MRYINRLLFVLLTIILLTACGQAQIEPSATPAPTSTPIPTTTPAPTPITVETLTQSEPAYVRFINTVPDLGAVNVYLDFSTIATNLAYTQYTESTQIDSGEYEVKILPSGSRQSDPALFETSLNINGGDTENILLVKQDGQLGFVTLPETVVPLNSGEAIITAINAMGDGSKATLISGETDLTVALNVGDLVKTSILDTSSESEIAYRTGDTTIALNEALREHENYTLVAVGTAAQPAIISFHSTAPNRVEIRAINATRDIPAIDVYLGETLLNANAGLGRPTERQAFAGGSYSVLIYSAGADRSTVEPLLNQVVLLDNSMQLALILLGKQDNLSLIVYPEDMSPIAADSARLALLNTLPDVKTVVVNTTAGSLGGEQSLLFGQQPTVLNISAGRYSFAMAGIKDDLSPPSTVEIAENVELEAGVSYLYLITGRVDNQPIILSETIDTDVSLSGDGAPDGITTGNPPEIRFVNAVEGASFDLASNGKVVIGGIGYGTGSNLAAITDHNAVLDIRSAGGNQSLAELESEFEAGSRHTIIAYFDANNSTQLAVVSDELLIFDGSSPHLRLINVSGDDQTRFDLAFIEPGPVPQNVTNDAINATEEVDSGPFTLPYGVQKLVTEISAGSGSNSVLMPVGMFDLDVINSTRNEIVVVLPSYSLGAGVHTDVIAFPRTDGSYQAFTIEYPRPA
ncbi:MAG: DUF4397 domain-containing protein [Anaerolineae bacterium]